MSYTVEPILGLRITTPGSSDGDYATNIEFNHSLIATLFGAPVPWPTAPAISSDGTAPTIVQASAGLVSKVGRLVDCAGVIGVTSRIGGTGYATVSLPYPAANIIEPYPGIAMFQINGFSPGVSGANNILIRPTPGLASGRIISSNCSTSADEVIGNIPAGMLFRFSGRYWANA